MTYDLTSFRERVVMSKLRTDHHCQFEFGQVISQPESLPGCVQVARYNNVKRNSSRSVVRDLCAMNPCGDRWTSAFASSGA